MLFLTVTTSGFKEKQSILTDQLILDIGKNDKEALSLLYGEVSSSVYGFALSFVRNHYLAQDIMQETFINIMVNASKYTPMGKPLAWILTITRNLSLMKLREKESKNLPFDNHIITKEAKESEDFSKISANKMVLNKALNALSDEERQIVILHSITGWKHREIAQMLNLPLSTVLSKNRRALIKLKKELKEDFSI